MNSNQFTQCPECQIELDIDSWQCMSCSGADFYEDGQETTAEEEEGE